MSLECRDCGIPYKDLGVDIVLPDQIWNHLMRDHGGSGVLCANCICKRLEENGETSVLFCWPDNYNFGV